MPLQTAATAKTASDIMSAAVTVRDTSLIAIAIEAEINKCKALPGGCYVAYFKFEYKRVANVVQLRQSNDSYIDFDEIINLLIARDFKFFHKFFSTNKVRLTVAWD